MKPTKIKGNTYSLSFSWYDIPYYLLNEKECIFFDSGTISYTDKLFEFLEETGLRVKAIISTHAHHDHIENNRPLKEKYGCKIYQTGFDAHVTSSIPTLKAVFYNMSIKALEERFSYMVFENDVIFPYKHHTINICGKDFEIIPLPGHAASHVGIITPDRVFYASDALLGEKELGLLNLAYNQEWESALSTMDNIRKYTKQGLFSHLQLAHSGSYSGTSEINKLVEDNKAFFFEKLSAFGEISKSVSTTEPGCEARFLEVLNIHPRLEEDYRVALRTVGTYLDYLRDHPV